MNAYTEAFLRPYHAKLSELCDSAPFSVAELLVGISAALILVYIIHQIVAVIRRPDKLHKVYITFITLLAAALGIYACFCLLWGAYYYADGFVDKVGFRDDPISTEELESVTRYFAALCNKYGAEVERDEQGVFTADTDELFAASDELYAALEKQYPELTNVNITPKQIHFSRLMSYTDFTGFFFPFTGEANLNIDSPRCYLPSTIAHEMAHQRGTAPEQQANFVAVLACMSYDDLRFRYSAALLAYTYLGNALYSADHAAWERVYDSLDDCVLTDFAYNRAYWESFETMVSRVQNKVYDGFLKSYGQSSGIKSYGECVDLLVNYYLTYAEVC